MHKYVLAKHDPQEATEEICMHGGAVILTAHVIIMCTPNIGTIVSRSYDL